MNGAQLHLVLNHVPVILSAVSLVILIWGSIRKSEEIKKMGLIFVIATAACAGAAFLTGDPAEDVLRKLPNFSKQLVHEHEDAGEAALIVSIIAGVVALSGLYFTQKKHKYSTPAMLLTMALVFMASLAFLKTAHLGGLIRHEEIRTPSEN